MNRLRRILAALRRRQSFDLAGLRIRCEEPAPNGRSAVCCRDDGHEGAHLWVFM
jgi:hypothetical protein